MVKIGKTDVRAALKDFIKDEARKQQKGEMDKIMKEHYTDSYTDTCPYCNGLSTVLGSKYNENAKVETVKGKRYLVGDCQDCKKPVYVYVALTPPMSMLDSPSARGYFFTKEYVYGEQPTQQNASGESKMVGVIHRK